MSETMGFRIITHQWMPKGFVAFQSVNENWRDTHTLLMTPEGKILDLGTPGDIFPPLNWESLLPPESPHPEKEI